MLHRLFGHRWHYRGRMECPGCLRHVQVWECRWCSCIRHVTGATHR